MRIRAKLTFTLFFSSHFLSLFHLPSASSQFHSDKNGHLSSAGPHFHNLFLSLSPSSLFSFSPSPTDTLTMKKKDTFLQQDHTSLFLSLSLSFLPLLLHPIPNWHPHYEENRHLSSAGSQFHFLFLALSLLLLLPHSQLILIKKGTSLLQDHTPHWPQSWRDRHGLGCLKLEFNQIQILNVKWFLFSKLNMIVLLPWKDLLMSSSWLAKWARQWTHEYVLQHLN